MKNFGDSLLGAMVRVWKKQLDMPLPEKLREYGRFGGRYECAAFPLFGWICGALIVLPAWFFAQVFNPFAGAFVYALLAWAFLTFRDSGRGDGAIASAVAGILPGEVIPWRVVVPVFMMICKFALLMLIFAGGNSWHLPLIIGGMFTMEMVLVLDGGFTPPLLDDSEFSRRLLTVVLVILFLLSFVLCRVPTALGAVAFLAAWMIFQKKSDREGTDLGEVSFAGAVSCWILLFAGVLTI